MLGFVLAALTATSPVALLGLMPVAADQYAPKPTVQQADELTQKMRDGLATPALGLTLVPGARIPQTQCADPECARKIGSSLGARTVVFGTVQHFSGILWTARVSAVDVRTGRVIDTVTYGAQGDSSFMIGDFYSLLRGFQRVGVCIGRSIAGQTHCEP